MATMVSMRDLPEMLHETLSAIDAHENIEHIIKDEPENDFIVTVDPCEDVNEYFVIEEYEEQFDPIEHPSVGLNKEDFLRRLREANQCYLCTDKIFSINLLRLEQHFIKFHLQHSIMLSDRMVIMCRLGCKKDSHFHCPQAECLFSCKYLHRLRLHYNLNHGLHHGSDATSLLQDESDRVEGGNKKPSIKLETNNYEDATFIKQYDDKILTEIYGDEDEMADVRTAKMSETLEGVNDMYHEDLNDEGKNKFWSILKQPSEKASVGHSREELIRKLKPPRCYLCPNLVQHHKSRLLRHFNNLHLGHHVKIANFFVASCKLECSRFSLSHYHCPYPKCMATVKVKNRLVGHFKKHLDYIHMSNKVKYGPSPADNFTKRHKNALLLDENMDFPAPKKTFDFSGVPFYPHISISANAAGLFEQLCLPFCFLCDDRKEFFVMPRLERHFRMAHLNRGVECGNCYLIQCGLSCIGGNVVRKHYHCPFCPLKDARRCAFWIHLEAHRREGTVADQLKKIRSEDTVSSSENSVLPALGSSTREPSSAVQDTTVSRTWDESYNNLPVRKVAGINTSTEAVLAAARLPHCYLCNDDKDYISRKRLEAHITRCHLKPFLKMGNLLVLLCKKYCGEKHQDKGHYHCLFCTFTCRQKQRVSVHVKKHVRNFQRKSDTAEYHLPEMMEDHSLPEEWVQHQNRNEVKIWEHKFNDYVLNDYIKKAKTNNNVLTERKKYLVYNHTRFNMEIEDKSLKYWVRFRGIKVLSCGQLGYHNVMVMPLTKYNNDEENRAINVQPEPSTDQGCDLMLSSTNPEEEFFKCYRLIPTREEFFKLLFKLHIMDSQHPLPKTMFGEIRRKYLYFPRSLVDKFVSLCPSCCLHFPDKSDGSTPVVTLGNADTIALAALQVTVVDMTEHPDGRYRYVVECFDRCSRLTWLIPADRAVATDLAEAVIRNVFSVTGLPSIVVTNCGHEFLEKMLIEIDKRWYGSCESLLSLSMSASASLTVLGSDDLMEALQELVTQQPTSWASALPHLQFRLNHTRGQQSQDQSAFEVVFGKQRSRPTWQRFLSSSTVQQERNYVEENDQGEQIEIDDDNEEEEEEEEEEDDYDDD